MIFDLDDDGLALDTAAAPAADGGRPDSPLDFRIIGRGRAATHNQDAATGANAPADPPSPPPINRVALVPYKGPFVLSCARFPTPDLQKEATRMQQATNRLFHDNSVTVTARTNIISSQPAPFPLLAIHHTTNTAVILHGLTNFYPPFGFDSATHPDNGAPVALLGEGSGPNMVPPVVRIPALALTEARSWPAATDTMIFATEPHATNLLPPDTTHTITTSRIIPLPPCLVSYFAERAQVPLLPLCKMFLTIVTDPQIEPELRLLCLPTAQFLRTAVTTVTAHTHSTNRSQLALRFEQIPWDDLLTHWTSSRYTVYHFLLPAASNGPPSPQVPAVPPPEIPPTNQAQNNDPNLATNNNNPAPPALRAAVAPPPLLANPPAPQNQHLAPQHQPLQAQHQPGAQHPGGHPAPLPPPVQHQAPAALLGQLLPQHVPHHNTPLTEERLAEIVSNALARTMQGAQAYLQPANLDNHIPNRMPKLAGTDLTNLYSWTGLRDGDPVPPFWEPFLNAPNDTNRTDILNSLLLDAQRHNAHVQFSIRPDLIKDLKGLKYHQIADTECPTRGVTPFALLKLTDLELREIKREEEAKSQATNKTIQDILRLNKNLVQPITEPIQFLELTATFRAFTYILFGDRSPLYIDADQLYQFARDSYNGSRMLFAVKEAQPNWFAHVLWAVTLATRAFFRGSLRLDQLDNGFTLPQPLQNVLSFAKTFAEFRHPNTPEALLPPLPGGRKRKGMGYDSQYAYKQQRNENSRTMNIPKPIFEIKRAMQQHIKGISLARALKESGSDIQGLMRATNTPHRTCCRYLFWGNCSEPTCQLTHDNVKLSQDQIDKTVALLKPGLTKLTATPPPTTTA